MLQALAYYALFPTAFAFALGLLFNRPKFAGVGIALIGMPLALTLLFSDRGNPASAHRTPSAEMELGALIFFFAGWAAAGFAGWIFDRWQSTNSTKDDEPGSVSLLLVVGWGLYGLCTFLPGAYVPGYLSASFWFLMYDSLHRPMLAWAMVGMMLAGIRKPWVHFLTLGVAAVLLGWAWAVMEMRFAEKSRAMNGTASWAWLVFVAALVLVLLGALLQLKRRDLASAQSNPTALKVGFSLALCIVCALLFWPYVSPTAGFGILR